MAKKWQIVEREGVTSQWSVPRTDKTIQQYNTEEEAVKVAKGYVTEINVDNALASAEKEAAAEVYFVDKEGCFLGVLDGEQWYMRYKKDETDRNTKQVIHKMGEIVKDVKYFELDKKGEVAVRVVPGTSSTYE